MQQNPCCAGWQCRRSLMAVTESLMRVGCGSATIGMFAETVDRPCGRCCGGGRSHITGVLSPNTKQASS